MRGAKNRTAVRSKRRIAKAAAPKRKKLRARPARPSTAHAFALERLQKLDAAPEHRLGPRVFRQKQAEALAAILQAGSAIAPDLVRALERGRFASAALAAVALIELAAREKK